MPNPWLTHVKKTMKQMRSNGSYKKGDGLKAVIIAAKGTYKKGKKGKKGKRGGGESDSDDDGKMKDVSLTSPTPPPPPPASSGMEINGVAVTGGRHRKTRRRRHSRRR